MATTSVDTAQNASHFVNATSFEHSFPHAPAADTADSNAAVSAAKLCDDSANWRAWQDHVASRSSPVALGELLEAKSHALLWGLSPPPAAAPLGLASLADGSLIKFIAWSDRLARRGASARTCAPHDPLDWLGQDCTDRHAAVRALAALGWCHALPALARAWPAEAWRQTLSACLDRVDDAPISTDDVAEAVAWQWNACELPMTLAYLWPEIESCRRQSRCASRALADGMAEFLDGEGMLHTRWWTIAQALLASWTRVLAMQRAVEPGEDGLTQQFGQVVEHALRLARRDASRSLSAAGARGSDLDLLQSAVRITGRNDLRAALELAIPTGASRRRRRPKPSTMLTPAATHSEWACAAVLRPGWSAREPRLVVDFGGREVAIELDSGRELLFCGAWRLAVTIDGHAAAPIGAWESICWESDDDADYLELECQLDGGVCVQRHIALGRKDRFLFLADTLLGRQSCDVALRSEIDLAHGVAFEPAQETQEGFLTRRGRRALVLPLGMPEWRISPAEGWLGESCGTLAVESRRAAVHAAFAPMWFDLDHQRISREATWRQLTVAQERKILPPDDAVGYRVQVGRNQWIVYRSLATRGNRTILGHNLVYQFMIARLRATGAVEPIVQIE